MLSPALVSSHASDNSAHFSRFFLGNHERKELLKKIQLLGLLEIQGDQQACGTLFPKLKRCATLSEMYVNEHGDRPPDISKREHREDFHFLFKR